MANTGQSSITVAGRLLAFGVLKLLLTCLSSSSALHYSRSCASVWSMFPCVGHRSLTLCRQKNDDGTVFLGDGSLAGVPAPKLHQRGIRNVIKVVDDRCLYARDLDLSPLASADMTQSV